MVEKMDGCKSCIETIIIPLSLWLQFFLEINITAERITQTIDHCMIACEKNSLSLKIWMTATLSVTETETLLQRMEGCI